MLRRPRISLALCLVTACTSGTSDKAASATEVGMPLWTLSSPSAEAREHMQKGERNDDGGHYLKAYEEFKRAVAADSAFAFGYLRVAQSSQSLDEYRTNLKRAAAYAGTANPTEKLLVEIEQKLFARDQQWALELAKQLVEKEPANARSWVTLSGIQIGAGEVEPGRISGKKALDLAPQYGAAHLGYGNSFVVLEPKDLAKAEEHILKGGQLWPKEPLSYDFLGDLRRAQGRLADAAAAYTRQIELDPREPEGYGQRAHSYTFLGKYDQARADYDAAVRASTGNGRSVWARYRALVSVYEGDIPASLKEHDQLIQAIDGMKIANAEGEKITALDTKVRLATHARLFDVAEKAIADERVLRMKSADRVGTPEFRRGEESAIAFVEARLAAFKGNKTEADRKIAEFARLVEQDRGPNTLRRVHALRGFTAYFQKNYGEAVREFEQGEPNEPYPWYYQAMALDALGRKEEAKALFKRLSTFNFNQPMYAAVRGDAIARAK